MPTRGPGQPEVARREMERDLYLRDRERQVQGSGGAEGVTALRKGDTPSRASVVHSQVCSVFKYYGVHLLGYHWWEHSN